MTHPADAAPLLAYPDPADALDATTRRAAPAASDVWHAGDLADGRYRLDRLLIRRGGTLTWLARDETLGRAVLLHLFPPGEVRTPEILDAARAAAAVVDSHFLRVLDATQARDPRDGALVVCEYAAGETLELVLRGGPLTADESCWLVREVADGLAAMHRAGLHHRVGVEPPVVETGSWASRWRRRSRRRRQTRRRASARTSPPSAACCTPASSAAGPGRPPTACSRSASTPSDAPRRRGSSRPGSRRRWGSSWTAS